MDGNWTDLAEYSPNLSTTDNNTWSDYYDGVTVTFFIGELTIYLDLYIVPVIIVLGLIGNTCSFLVFVTTHLRSLSSSVYLSALAVSDNGFLICVFISWLNNVHVHLYHRNVWCQLFVYLTYVFSFLSVWYVVGFTVERYIAVCFPFKRCDMCTTKRAKIVVVAMALFAAIAYTFALWTSSVDTAGAVEPFCMPRQQYMGFIDVMNNIDTATTLILPSFALLFFNLRIVWAVGLVSRDRKYMRDSTSSESAATLWSRWSSDNSGVRPASHMRVTRMLLVVSSVFLALNLPGHAFRVYLFIMQLVDKTYSPGELFFHWQRFFLYVYYINFAINIFLYSICGKNFRLALKSLVLRRRRRRQRSTRGVFGVGTPSCKTLPMVLRSVSRGSPPDQKNRFRPTRGKHDDSQEQSDKDGIAAAGTQALVSQRI